MQINVSQLLKESIGAKRNYELAEIVKDNHTGLTFEAGNDADLSDKIQFLLRSPDVLAKFRENARAFFDAEFNVERNHEILMEVYCAAINDFQYQKKIKEG